MTAGSFQGLLKALDRAARDRHSRPPRRGVGGLPSVSPSHPVTCDKSHPSAILPRPTPRVGSIDAQQRPILRLSDLVAFAVRMLGLLAVTAGRCRVVVAASWSPPLDWPRGVLSIVVLLGVGARRGRGPGRSPYAGATVVRLDEHGYRVRFVRGAGVTPGRWKDVEDVVATTVEEPAASCCDAGTARPRRSRSASSRPDRGTFVQRPPAAPQPGPRLPPGRLITPPRAPLGADWLPPAGRPVACARCLEVSPSPVYGARLLSGLRVIPSRGFKSRHLRQIMSRPRTRPGCGAARHSGTDCSLAWSSASLPSRTDASASTGSSR